MKTSIQKLILSLVWLALPMLAQAQFTFTTNNGAITITGYTGPGGAVVIPAVINGYSVIGIGNSAFEGNLNMTSVTIPDSVTKIGGAAFGNIGDAGYPLLTNVIIGNGVTNIGSQAFYDCQSLANATIGNSVASIGNEAFLGTALTSVAIPNSVSSIGSGAFGGNYSLTNATIGNNVASIGNQAFAETGLTSVTIPNSVTNIGSSAFEEDHLLASVTIGNGVTSIEAYAFEDDDTLTRVTLPASVTIIGSDAFYECVSLTAAYFQGNEPLDNVSLFGEDDSAIVYYLAGTTGWGPTFGGVPTMLWNPQAHAPSFTGDQFGFNLTGPTNAVIVVEACTNLANPVWLPVATNNFSSSGTSSFTDPSGQPSRFYRFRSP
jgi:BspA type Leucine rich repeat region (6 copies)